MIFTVLTVTADDTTLKINPSNQTVSTDETFTIDVYCVPTEPIKGYELEISFDKSLIKAISVNDGSIFDSFPYSFNSGTIDNSAGLISSIYGFIIGPGNTTNPGTLCNITFSSKSYGGTCHLKFNRVGEWTGIVNEIGYLSIDVVDGRVKIDGPVKAPPVSSGQPYTPPTPPPIDEENHPPETPMKPSGPTFIELGLEYLFETSTFDIDENQIRIKFDWGDGSFSEWSEFISSNSSVGVSHVWNNASTFSVRAIAQDKNGLNSSWSAVLSVTVSQVDNDTIPIPSIKVLGEPITNETITFNASESFDPERKIVSYYWDFGDGTNGTNETLVHKYQYPGEYIVSLTITDDKGYNYSKSITITVLGAQNENTKQDSDKSIVFSPFLLRNLILGICIIILILLIFIYRINFKKYVTLYLIRPISKIINKRDKRKIERIDNKINRIQGRMESLGIPRKHVGFMMDSSIYESKPRYISADMVKDTNFIDKEDKYDTRSKYERFLLDFLKSDSYLVKDSDQIKFEEDVDVLVDRLLLDKMLKKHSFDSVKDLEKTVDDHFLSKDFNDNV